MANFSGAILLSDLDDFIKPSQECIKPVEMEKAPAGRPRGRIEIDQSDGSVFETFASNNSKLKLQKVKITLSDCLACSGCITSAESFLVNRQSVDEVLARLKSKTSTDVFVASVSTQTLISFSAQLCLSLQSTASYISSRLRSFGFDFVFDVGSTRSVSLLAACDEFLEKIVNKSNLPIFASACPGWVCYAEKTKGVAPLVLSKISRVRSPQQIMGGLVKRLLARKLGGKKIFHVSLMPCYDKKLEASRAEFAEDVDIVLTTGELGQLFETFQLEPDSRTNSDGFFDSVLAAVCSAEDFGPQNLFPVMHLGSGSGGYAEHLLRYSAMKSGIDSSSKIELRSIRSEDLQELSFPGFEHTVAICNGFRNIQNVVQKLKQSRLQAWAYIEIMACPSGCIGGGGQLPLAENESSANSSYSANKGLLAKMKQTFSESERRVWAWEDEAGCQLFEYLKVNCPDILWTNYKEVEQTITSTLKW